MQGSNTVSWRDYEGVDGFGQTTVQDLVDLKKALTVGNSINAPGAFGAGDGFALRVESLDQTLKNVTYRMEHVRLWKAIPKGPAFNTVEEFNQVTDYGQLEQGAWVAEGGLPNETDATYTRNYRVVKFLGTLRSVSHVASLVKPAHGNLIAQETVAGTMYLLRQLERNLFFGDSSLDPLQWDGVDKQITDGAPASNIIDLRGEPLSEDVLIDAALTIQDAPNYGTPTHLFLDPKRKADLVKTFFPKARYDLFNKTDSGNIGMDIGGFTSPAGDVKFEPDVFIGETASVPAAAVGSNSPANPTIASATAGAGTGSLFTAADAGTYIYQVVAVNSTGQSAAVATSGVAVTATQQVTITIDDDAISASLATAPVYYRIFRTAAGGAAATAKEIGQVARAAPGSDTVFIDRNLTLPNTSNAYMFQMNSDNMGFKQLAPMVKVPLATINASIRWMQLLYGTPIVCSPGRNVIFRNVGRAANFVGAP